MGLFSQVCSTSESLTDKPRSIARATTARYVARYHPAPPSEPARAPGRELGCSGRACVSAGAASNTPRVQPPRSAMSPANRRAPLVDIVIYGGSGVYSGSRACIHAGFSRIHAGFSEIQHIHAGFSEIQHIHARFSWIHEHSLRFTEIHARFSARVLGYVPHHPIRALEPNHTQWTALVP